MSSRRLIGALVALLACVAVPATVVGSSLPAEAAGSNTLTVTAGEYAYTLKGSPKAGNVQIDFVNGGVEYHMMAMVRLKSGVTAAQLKKAALSEDDKAFAKIAQGDGNVAPTARRPRSEPAHEHDHQAGRRALRDHVLHRRTVDGAPHVAHGMVKVFDVSSSKSSLTPPTDGVIDVTLTDTAAMTLPSTGLPATGWAKIINSGTTNRDFNVALLNGTTTVAQADAYFNAFFNSGTAPTGTPPAVLVGGVNGIPKGSDGVLRALDLAKGRYAYASSQQRPRHRSRTQVLDRVHGQVAAERPASSRRSSIRAVHPLISIGGRRSVATRARRARGTRRRPGCRAPTTRSAIPVSPPADTAGSIGMRGDERHADLARELLAATAPEQRVPGAVGGHELTHVLDHARDLHVGASRHVGDAHRDLLRGERRCGDHEHLRLRQHAGEAHLDVAGAGRHVDQQVVEVAPPHVGEELLERLGEDEAAPHERGAFVVDEEAHRHDVELAGSPSGPWPRCSGC